MAPQITTALYTGGVVSVSAIIPELVDSGGVCMLAVVADGLTATATGTALANASSTSCGELTVRAPSPASSVTVQISYQSPAAHGNSSPMTLEQT